MELARPRMSSSFPIADDGRRRTSYDERRRQPHVLGFKSLLDNQPAQHTPTEFGDLGAGLRDDADRGVQHTQRFEIIHDEQSDILRDSEADTLDGGNNTLCGDVAGGKDRLGPQSACEDAARGLTNFGWIK